MTGLAAILAIALFAATSVWVELPGAVGRAFGVARSALLALRDPALGDDQKERLAKSFAAALFAETGRLLWRGAVALAPAALLLAILHASGAVRAEAVLALFVRWELVAAASAALLIAWLGWRLLRRLRARR